MFNIVLVQPEIPPNTGNVIRLAANTGCNLHLIEPLGFTMDSKQLRRAGLDYHESASVRRHTSWSAFVDRERPCWSRCFAMSAKAETPWAKTRWRAGDWLVFGGETSGLPPEILGQFPPDRQLRLPMRPGQRSLNLSNAVAVTVFEAWRQLDFAGGA